METNKIYHLNFLNNTLPDNCANLIIADPPYFEVKGARSPFFNISYNVEVLLSVAAFEIQKFK